MNRQSMCVHCGINHGNEPCQRSELNNKEDLRSSPSSSTGLPRPKPYQSPRTPPKPYVYDIYPPTGGRTSGQSTYQHTRYPGLIENCNFGPSKSSTPVRSPNLDQLNQTVLALSTQNQTTINKLIKHRLVKKKHLPQWQKQKKENVQCRLCINKSV